MSKTLKILYTHIYSVQGGKIIEEELCYITRVLNRYSVSFHLQMKQKLLVWNKLSYFSDPRNIYNFQYLRAKPEN